jgi:hypothetical protein
MAFIAFQSEEDHTAFQVLCLSLGVGLTALAAKEGRVFAVADMVLDELVDRGIRFLPLPEDQLPQVLTERGLAYYRVLREKNPEHLYFNAPLPPALHVTLTCSVPEPNLEAVRQIVGRYEPIAFKTEEVTVIPIFLDADDSGDILPMVRVEFTVPRKHKQAVMEELMASGAAGFSRETAIYLQSDPDGPPSGEQSGHGR